MSEQQEQAAMKWIGEHNISWQLQRLPWPYLKALAAGFARHRDSLWPGKNLFTAMMNHARHAGVQPKWLTEHDAMRAATQIGNKMEAWYDQQSTATED